MTRRIIPVIDLKQGQAVRAVGGRRDDYSALQTRLIRDANPIELARAYRDCLDFSTLYVADLDAIAGSPSNLLLYEAIRTLGVDLWVDAGIREAHQFSLLKNTGISGLIVGLETVNGPKALREILADSGAEGLIFSLDLENSTPRLAPGADWGATDPEALAAEVAAAGVQRMILLDLAVVGTGRGLGTLGLARRLARRCPRLEIVLGGGVAGPEDVREAFRAGVSAVLVGSALHDGRIGSSDLDRLLDE